MTQTIAKHFEPQPVITAANDSIQAEGPHHAAVLDLLRDLHTVIRCANLSGAEVTNTSDVIAWGMNFEFWDQEIARALNQRP